MRGDAGFEIGSRLLREARAMTDALASQRGTGAGGAHVLSRNRKGSPQAQKCSSAPAVLQAAPAAAAALVAAMSSAAQQRLFLLEGMTEHWCAAPPPATTHARGAALTALCSVCVLCVRLSCVCPDGGEACLAARREVLAPTPVRTIQH